MRDQIKKVELKLAAFIQKIEDALANELDPDEIDKPEERQKTE